ncbi:site-specific DNA-methyltransferase [Corynebacterium testudinoris]|uniref:DNA methylase n=1 Tax=Corynebacterium testudinoris TaxID=136857 RepID=A0A0G3HB36_9CORY|nr:site-specific DNA-methyltransferase [Corynebacterium testudinoris]AKK09910.1 DNA methylase [Corynebacterium testudinoris]
MADQITLSWPGKELLLAPSGDSKYEWVDPKAHHPRPLDALHVEAAVPGQSHGLVICGDALDVLMQPPSLIAKKSVRLVYVDPPFNTGYTFGDYDDAMDSGQWLSMLRDRLAAVKPLLRDDASVWIHLDDSESHRARCVLDEVFGTKAYVATIVWQRRTTRESRSAISTNHDTILVYAPAGPVSWKKRRNLLMKGTEDLRNRDHDPRGPWADAPFTAPGYRANQQYTIVTPTGRKLSPPRGRSWYATEETYRQLVADDRIWFPKGGAGSPRLKLFPHQLRGLVPFSVWSAAETGTNDDGKRHLQALFPEGLVFATPKPEELLERIIHVATDPGELVLDLFGGSGTTGTTAHKMSRNWVLVERNPRTVSNVMLPRLAKVLMGHDQGGVSAYHGWAGGGSVSVYRAKPAKGRGGTVKIPVELLAARTKVVSQATA